MKRNVVNDLDDFGDVGGRFIDLFHRPEHLFHPGIALDRGLLRVQGQLIGLIGVQCVLLSLGGDLRHRGGDLLHGSRLFGGALGQGLAGSGDMLSALRHLLGGIIQLA